MSTRHRTTNDLIFQHPILRQSDPPHRQTDGNTSQYRDSAGHLSKGAFAHLFYAYKLDPKAVLSLGYSHDGTAATDFDQLRPPTPVQGRTLFIKLGYAWHAQVARKHIRRITFASARGVPGRTSMSQIRTHATRSRLWAAAALLIGTCTLTVAAQPASGQETFAVFVGINDYIEFGDEPGGDLQGAESDALFMKAVLTERWAVPEENTLTLLSTAATKAAIHQAITVWLAERAKPDDLAIFYFAGHGSQAYDLDGDEPDDLDETLAPADVQQLSSVNDIRDDEFRAWLSSIGTDVVVILDSCHSGTATRGSSEMRTRSLDRPTPPEENEPEAVRQAFDTESMVDGNSRILELAAAAPNQSALEGPFGTSGEKSAEPRGAFTYFLIEELSRVGPDATYEQVMRAVSAKLLDEDFPQTPQLNGTGATPLFRKGGSGGS